VALGIRVGTETPRFGYQVCLVQLNRFSSLWRIRHLSAITVRIPPPKMRTYRWRNSVSGWGHHVGSGEYLRWLAENDYPLAPVEEIVTKAKDAEQIYERHLADAVKE
jgi:hypothetical protein